MAEGLHEDQKKDGEGDKVFTCKPLLSEDSADIFMQVLHEFYSASKSTGGGTLDVSLLTHRRPRFEVKPLFCRRRCYRPWRCDWLCVPLLTLPLTWTCPSSSANMPNLDARCLWTRHCNLPLAAGRTCAFRDA